ncbi:hypothetical protein D3C72_1225880 [compost metagenome]
MDVIHHPVRQPLRPPGDPLLLHAEPLAHRPAGLVLQRGADLHLLHPHLLEGVMDQGLTGPGDDAVALPALRQPVADADLGQPLIDLVVTDDADHFPLIFDGGGQPLASGKFLDGVANEGGAVRGLLDMGHPGQPLGEIVAIALAEAKEFAGHVGLQEQERQFVIQLP